MKKIVSTLIMSVVLIVASLTPQSQQIHADEGTVASSINITYKEAQGITDETLKSLLQKNLNDYRSELVVTNQASVLNHGTISLDPYVISYTYKGVVETMPIYIFEDIDRSLNLGIYATSFVAQKNDFLNMSVLMNKSSLTIVDLTNYSNVTANYNVILKRSNYNVGVDKTVIFEVRGTTLKSYVNVDIYSDVVGEYGLVYQSFQSRVDEVTTVESIIQKANVRIYKDKQDVTNTLGLELVSNVTQGVNQAIVLKSKNEPIQITIYADIYDVMDNQRGLYAHGFNALMSDIQSEQDIITRSQAVAKELSENSQACRIVVANYSSLQKGKNTVTLSTCGVTLDIIVNLYDEISDVNNLGLIYDEGYFALDEIANQAVQNERFNVRAYNLSDGQNVAKSISFDVPSQTGVDQISNVLIDGTQVIAQVPTHVYRFMSGNMGIVGEDVVTTINRVKSSEDLLNLMNVKAYTLPENKEVLDRKVKVDAFTPVVGLQQDILIDVVGADVSLTHKADIYNDIDGDKGLLVHDFIATTESVKTQEDVVHVADPKVYDINTRTELNTKVSTQQSLGRGNNQTVNFKADKLNATAIVHVFDAYNALNQEGMNIDAFDVLLGLINPNILKTRSKVELWDTASMQKMKLRDISLTSPLPNQTGEAMLTFQSKKGTTIKTAVNVLESWISLSVNNVALSVDEFYGFSEQQILELMNAKGYDEVLGQNATDVRLVGINRLRKNPLMKNEPLKLTVEVSSGRYVETKDVYIYVYDVVNDARSVAINATSATTGKNPVYMSDDEILSALHAEAWDISDINNRNTTRIRFDEIRRNDLSKGLVTLVTRGLARTYGLTYIEATAEIKASDVYFDLDELQSYVEEGTFKERFLEKAQIRVSGRPMNDNIYIENHFIRHVE